MVNRRAKTVLYMRVSTDNQNTDRQEAELKRWAIKEGINEYQLISEIVSGRVPTSERKLAQVLDDESLLILAVTELDRLGRDAMDIRNTPNRLGKYSTK